MFDPETFMTDRTGRLVAIGGRHFAFVPNALPPDIEYEARVVQPLEEATLALGQLKGIGHSLPNPHMLIPVFQQQEALSSSRIEGTVAEQQELLFAEIDRKKSPADN